MENFKSWKFWIAMVLTIAVGPVLDFFGPSWFIEIVILCQVITLVFYFKCEYDVYSLAHVSVDRLEEYEEKIPEEPGYVFRGIGFGIIIFFIVFSVIKFTQN